MAHTKRRLFTDVSTLGSDSGDSQKRNTPLSPPKPNPIPHNPFFYRKNIG